MKKLLFLLPAFLLFFTNCKKSDSTYKHTGVITAYDYSTCPCCGGYILQLDGKDTLYHATAFPAGSSIDSTHLPIKINLNFAPAGLCGTNRFITIESMIVVY